MAPMQIAWTRLAAATTAAAAILGGCHVTARSETLRPMSTERIVHPEGAIAHRAALALGDAGRLRFVEPLECPTEEIVHQRSTIELATRPNLATFTVGVIATAIGGVLLTTGLFSNRPGASPATYVGLAGAGVGLSFAIGPWLGTRVDVRDGDAGTVRQPGPSQPCGDRPLAARTATLQVSGLEVHGAVDRDGSFAISPYQWIDAYAPESAQASEVTAIVDGAAGPRTVNGVLDARWLAAHAADFLAHADFDAAIQPLRRVPGLVAGALRASLVDGDGSSGSAAVRIALPLRNDGPGDAWAVRGQITAPGVPAIDGRIVYVGKLARGASVSRELAIPVAPGAAAALRGRRIELSIELRDAHGTAPTTPVRFAGTLGAGVAGLAAARALIAAGHTVAIYEAAPRPGGHVYTVDADGHAVDLGFIVCNRERYPAFFALLGELGIATRPTAMSFSVAIPGDAGDDLEWGSASLGAVFADRRRLFDPRHWRFLVEILGFVRRAAADLAAGRAAGASLDDYLARGRTSRELRDRFLVPLAAALWSLAPDRCGEFPAELMLRFLDQHGMLRPVRPLAWHTIVGGSRRYVDALIARLRTTGRLALACGAPVAAIARDAGGVTIVAGGREHRHDRVVVATHADTALAVLDRSSPDERRVLGAFRYSANRTVLHTDRRFLPRRPAAHASWNYVADPDTSAVAVTYSMTRLQGLPDAPYLVTLNPRRPPDGVLHEVSFAHPQLDRAALAAQAELPGLGAAHRTGYAGAHFGFGFHEDGMRAGIAVAARIAGDEHRPAEPP